MISTPCGIDRINFRIKLDKSLGRVRLGPPLTQLGQNSNEEVLGIDKITPPLIE
jgi:hypothetical protein